ncbi:MAG: cyclic nucleotide-binding domain-containing protein [Candidatus Sericytochromatia bacterium]|nr:cyclic nucleotide-binding domain-containing protein [Candidatus Sericytochromatia bacterium]
MDEAQRQAILNKIHALKDLRIFYNMNDRDVFEVMKRCETRHYAAGEVVFAEGDTDHRLYVIVKGEFEITTQNTLGEPMRFFCAGEGLIFGEMAFLDAQPRSAKVTATEAAEVFSITPEQFSELLDQQPATAARFMMGVAEILSRRLRGANQRIKHAT